MEWSTGKGKKWGRKKRDRRVKERKWKVKGESKNYIEILLSMHARTSEANILHLEQRVALKCLTHKMTN